jgi:hypothetical protein
MRLGNQFVGGSFRDLQSLHWLPPSNFAPSFDHPGMTLCKYSPTASSALFLPPPVPCVQHLELAREGAALLSVQ